MNRLIALFFAATLGGTPALPADQAKDQDQSLKDRLAALAVEKGSLKLGKAELKVSPPHSIEIKDLNPFIISIAAPKSIFVNLGAARERLDLRSVGERIAIYSAAARAGESKGFARIYIRDKADDKSLKGVLTLLLFNSIYDLEYKVLDGAEWTKLHPRKPAK